MSISDLFGFEAAQMRLQDTQNHESFEGVEVKFKPWRVFVNCIDSYHGKRIVEVKICDSLKNLTSGNVILCLPLKFVI